MFLRVFPRKNRDSGWIRLDPEEFLDAPSLTASSSRNGVFALVADVLVLLRLGHIGVTLRDELE